MYTDIRSDSPKFARIRSFSFVVRMRSSRKPGLEHYIPLHTDWDITWKSRGGKVVIGVPREVLRSKPEGKGAENLKLSNIIRFVIPNCTTEREKYRDILVKSVKYQKYVYTPYKTI